nr:hypothetical protein [Candidatus Sigynarchaeota archaeon]
MAKIMNPIDEQYWQEIWTAYDQERMLAKRLGRESAKIKFKIALLAIALLVFFTIPMIPFFGGARLVSLAEFFTFEGYNLDDKIRGTFPNPLDYYFYCQFIYKWFGYASAACLLYWAFFINPYEKMGKRDVRAYIHDMIYDEPKHPGVFLKKALKEERYRWAGFFYMWCVGYLICTIQEAPQWSWIAEHQYYWLHPWSTASLPSPVVPIALISLLVVNVVFALFIGMAKPRSKSGSAKKTATLGIIGACTFVTILIAVLNASSLQLFVDRWEEYAIRYPENPLDTGPEYFINYNVLFWTLGMILSALGGWLFPLCCTTYQNLRFRKIIDGAYHNVLEKYDTPWEHAPLRVKNNEIEKRKQFIPKFSAFELAFFFGLFLVSFWGFYFYWADVLPNLLMRNIGIGIMAFEVIWALILSPIVHHKLERDTTYQGKGVAWVLSEDRGIGAWQKYWKLVGAYESKGIPDDQIERKKTLDIAKHLTVLLLVSTVCLLGCTGVVADVFGGEPYNVITAFAVSYLLVALFYILELSRLHKNMVLGKRGFEHKGRIKQLVGLAIFLIIVTIGAIAALAYESISDAFDDTNALIDDAIVPLAVVIAIVILFYMLIWPLSVRFSFIKNDRKFWKNWKVKKVDRLPEAERAKVLPAKRLAWVLSGIFALWGCGAGMYEQAVYELFAGFLHVTNAAINGMFAVIYMVIAPILLLYAVSILKFNDPKDPERGKKRIYGILLEIFLACLVLGIADVFNRTGDKVAILFLSTTPFDVLKVAGVGIGVLGGVILALNLGCFPIFVRLGDLYKSIPDLLKIVLIGSILLPIWNYLCQWFLTDPRLHWSWLSGPTQDPVYLRDHFLIGSVFYGIGGYFFWGWVQEMLFLGYFCWLLYKIQPNKYINAVLTALLFMMFHWDNVALMIGTAAGALFWAMWWGERRNLFILGWTHGFNGTLVDWLIPMSMSVGPGVHGG